MKRHITQKSVDEKIFKHTAVSTKKVNIVPSDMRGGFRMQDFIMCSFSDITFTVKGIYRDNVSTIETGVVSWEVPKKVEKLLLVCKKIEIKGEKNEK